MHPRLFADAQSCLQLRDFAQQFTEDHFIEVRGGPYGMVWYGKVWYGMVWLLYGMVWYGMVYYCMLRHGHIA